MSSSTVLYDAPGPKAVIRNVVVSVLTLGAVVAVIIFVLVKLANKGQLTAAKWKPFTTGDLWRTYILPGAEGTMKAAALSIVLALALGVVLGVGRLSTANAVRWVSATLVELFRALPVLIMMTFAFFLFAQYDVFPAKQLALAGVVTGLTLYNGAVIAEIVRAGVNALPRGQSQAASALGLSPSQTMRLILLPQAVTAMLPALISQLVVVLKDAAIGYQITFVEMVRQGTLIGAQYSNYIPALFVIAVLMIAVNMTLSWLAVRVESRLRRRSRSAAPAAPVTRTAEMDTAGA
jgi:glutamate transport system permease protein